MGTKVQSILTAGRSKPVVQKRGSREVVPHTGGDSHRRATGLSSLLMGTSLPQLVCELDGCRVSSWDLLMDAVYEVANRDFHMALFYLSFTKCFVLG